MKIHRGSQVMPTIKLTSNQVMLEPFAKGTHPIMTCDLCMCVCVFVRLMKLNPLSYCTLISSDDEEHDGVKNISSIVRDLNRLRTDQDDDDDDDDGGENE
jgi:hypothetical protein